jgi:protein-export membrane protein SecD
MLYFAPWKTTLILLTVLAGVLFALPNALPPDVRASMPGFLPTKTINLGLDLRGGSHLLYEVDLSQVRMNELEGALERAATLASDEGCSDAAAPRAGLFCPVFAGQAVLDDYATLRVVDQSQSSEVLSRLRDRLPFPDGTNAAVAIATGQVRLFDVSQGDGPGEIRIRVTDDYLQQVRQRTIGQSTEIIRRRIDELGTTEPVIQRQGADRIVVQAPGEQNPERLKDIVGRTAQMTFHLVVPSTPAELQRAVETGITPRGTELVETDDPTEPYLLVRSRLDFADTTRGPDGNLVRVLSGQFLRNASQGFHPTDGTPIVNFTFDTTGAVIFGKLTANHIRERFAVVLDDRVITAPVIESQIPTGSGFIRGNFTIESASDLAALLNAGALPAPLTIVEERTVGPSLGADSIRAGAFALTVGLISVVVFMMVAYGGFGLFANIALLVNVVLIMGSLSGLGATLTLPGIGGMILTIGMAVDANVLIYERIREEAMAGRTPANAIEAGFARAMSAILDANITTMIAAVLLFQFGTGPVRGFAVTLALGLITSVFTAVLFTRLLIATWYRAVRPKKVTI